MVASTKLLASSMKRANAPFVFVIVRSCIPKSELILLISFSFNSVLVCLIRIHSSVLTSKRRIISILNVRKVYNLKRKRLQMSDLMDDAARVRSLEFEAAFDSYSNERNAGMIASSVLDSYLHRNAAHQGFLS
jgi:hypothetical protein